MPQHNYWKLYQLPRIIVLTNINFQKDFKIHRTEGRWEFNYHQSREKTFYSNICRNMTSHVFKIPSTSKMLFLQFSQKNKFRVQRKMSKVYVNQVPSTYNFHIMLWQKTSIQNKSVFSGEPKIKHSVSNNLVPGEIPLPQLSWLVTGLSPWRPTLNPSPVCIGFVANKVTNSPFFWCIPVFTCQCHSTSDHTHISCTYHQWYLVVQLMRSVNKTPLSVPQHQSAMA